MQFTRGQTVAIPDIPDRSVFECIQVVGGSPCARYVVVNSTSLFSFEPITTEPAPTNPTPTTQPPPPPQQGTLISQRSLLEIGRVTFIKTQSFTVHFKTSSGGDQVEYKYQSPLDVVGAIRTSLNELGVKGKHTQNANASSAKSPQRRIQGGSFRERPRDAIKRLEGEMNVRPTLTIVRAIMDRYRRLIDAHVMDPSAASQKEAEQLMHAQHQFLMREDVTKTLNSETQILKQREKRSTDDAIDRDRERSRSKSTSSNEGNDKERAAQEMDANTESKERAGETEEDVTKTGASSSSAAQDNTVENASFAVGAECNTIMGKGVILDIRQDDTFKIELQWVLAYDCKVILYSTLTNLLRSQGTDKKKAPPGSHERGDSIDGTVISRSNSNDETEDNDENDGSGSGSGSGSKDSTNNEWPAGLTAVATTTEEEELDQMMDGYSDSANDEGEDEEVDCTFVGVPYRRQAGEVYYCRADTQSQVNHARVAEQGIFLGSGRHQTLFLLKKEDR